MGQRQGAFNKLYAATSTSIHNPNCFSMYHWMCLLQRSHWKPFIHTRTHSDQAKNTGQVLVLDLAAAARVSSEPSSTATSPFPTRVSGEHFFKPSGALVAS